MERKKKQKTMKTDKKKHFEVSRTEGICATAALALVTAATVVTHWGELSGSAGAQVAAMVGAAGAGVGSNTAVQGIGAVLLAAGQVTLLELLRRAMRHVAKAGAWTVGLWAVLTAIGAVVAAVPEASATYAYAHTPTAWDSFRATFLANNSILCGLLQVATAAVCAIRFRGRALAYGLSLIVCPLVAGALTASAMTLWQQSGGAPGAAAWGCQTAAVVTGIVPAALLRLAMTSRREAEPCAEDGDVSHL